MLREALSLTESSMLQDVFLSSQTTIHMWFLSQAEQSYIRECSLWSSSDSSSWIYRILITSQQSPQYIRDSLQIQTQAGRDLIQTDLSCTMVRLILFLETLTRCQHVRRTWSLQSLKKSSRRFYLLSMRQALTQRCSITHLNFW